jgi:TP901 family phage tail tape measure protein
MADVVRDILIRLIGQDDTGAALSSFSGGLTDVNNKISGVTQPIADFNAKLALVAAGAVAAGTALAAIAVNEASQFSEKMEEIGSLVNATPDDVDRLGTAIEDLAVSTAGANSSLEAIEQATYNATSALGSSSAAVDIMATSSKGAEVGATDLNTATTLLTGTLNAYGLVTSDSATNNTNAERVMAAMFTTVQNGVIDMQALSDNMGKVSSTAAGAGVPIEQVGASIATLTGAGINAEQSFTKLNALILELTAPSEDLQEALGGVSLEADGLPAVLDKLQTATGGSTTKFNELFGSSEAASAALVLSNDSAGKFDATLNAMSSSVESFNTAFEQMSGGVAGSAQQLSNSINSLFIDAGQPLQDDWQAILDSLRAITESFRATLNSGAFSEVYDAIDVFADEASKQMDGIAAALPDALEQVNFDNLIAAVQNLTGTVSGVFGDIDLTNSKDLAGVIQSLVDGATNLTLYFAEVGKTLTPLLQDLVGFATNGGTAGEEAATAAGRIAGLSLEFNTLSPLINGVTGFMSSLGTALTALAWTQTANGAATLASNLGLLSTSALAVAAPIVAIGSALAIGYLAWEDYNASVAASEKTQADVQLQIENANKALQDQNATFSAISEATGLVVTSWDDVSNAVDNGVLSYNAANDTYSLTKQGFDELGLTIDGVRLSHEALNEFVDAGVLVWNDAAGEYLSASENASALAKSVQDAGGGLGELNTKGKDNATIFADIIKNYEGAQSGADKYLTTIDGVTLTENQLNAAIDAGLVSWNAQTGEFEKSSAAIDLNDQKTQSLISNNDLLAKTLLDLDPSLGGVRKSFEDAGDALQVYNQFIADGGQGTIDYVDGLYYIVDANNATKAATDDVKKATEDTTAANVRGSEEWARTAEAMNNATQIANEFTIAALQIAGQRYEATVTAIVDLKVSDIEAQTERIKASFESLNEGIASTGDTLSSLVDTFANLGVLGAGDAYEFIKGLIEDENARRQQEFDLQSQLVNAQVAYMQAQTDRLSSGEALITINGTELVPSLQLVLSDIVQLAHVEASEFANSFLLGIS